MVGLPQDCDHLSLHKFPTVDAERAMKPLEVHRAKKVTILHKEATLTQVTATDLASKALYVEVIGLDSQHLSLAWLPTPEALDAPLPCWTPGMAAILSV